MIIDLDPDATLHEMTSLLGLDRKMLSQFYTSEEFLLYETGFRSDDEFRSEIRTRSKNEITDEQIDDAWNAMLLDLPADRLDLVNELRSGYKLIVLSNTNGIHVKKFNHKLQQSTGKGNLHHFFDVVYFSHEIKMRKPDKEIYQFVLDQNQLNAEETLFLDDNLNNLEAAAALGIKTHHIDFPNRLFEIF